MAKYYAYISSKVPIQLVCFDLYSPIQIQKGVMFAIKCSISIIQYVYCIVVT